MNQNSIAELIAASDITELASRYSQRYGDEPSLDHLRAVCDILTDPNRPEVGGTNEDPWSDDTWLVWIHNRLTDLREKPLEKVRARFIKPAPPPLDSVEAWRRFLDRYRLLAARVARLEGWSFPEDWEYRPATQREIAETEDRLGVRLPPSLRNFYLVTNGWPADGWTHPAINPLDLLNYLEFHKPDLGLYAIADEAERCEKPFPDDPDGSRRDEYRFEEGTRVKRSIALNFDTDDTGTVLVDPVVASGTEWPCAKWAHFYTGMDWSDRSFADYMQDRYDYLVWIEEEHEY